MANMYFSLVTVVLVAFSAAPSRVEAVDCTITSYSQVSAVTAACKSITVGSFTVPAKTTLNFNLKDGASLYFTGTIKWTITAWSGFLIRIVGNKVTVTGSSSHLLHGNGQTIWDGKGLSGGQKPTFMYLKGTDSTFKNLHVKNCPARCVGIDSSSNTVISGFTIDNSEGAIGTAASGKEAHNTDGFDVASSTYITLKDNVVINQDDCVAINSGQHVTIDNFKCTGSNGFDIATGMSSDYSLNVVQHISISNSVLKGGMVGLHILTASDGGKGEVSDVTYSNIEIQGPSYAGIMIQQDFSNAKQDSTLKPVGNVPISNIKFSNVKGYMSGTYSTAIVLRCASGACTDLSGSGISITGAMVKNNCSVIPPGFPCY